MRALSWRLVATATLSMACGASVPARGSLGPVRHEGAELSPDEVFGRTVRVRARGLEYRGELIACDPRNLYVLLHLDGPSPYERIPWRDTSAVAVTLPGYGPELLAWSILGTVSSLSHGFFAVFSVPIWAGVGGTASAAAWRQSVTASDCEEARVWARFPQGLPSSFRARFGLRTETPSELLPPWEVQRSGRPGVEGGP